MPTRRRRPGRSRWGSRTNTGAKSSSRSSYHGQAAGWTPTPSARTVVNSSPHTKCQSECSRSTTFPSTPAGRSCGGNCVHEWVACLPRNRECAAHDRPRRLQGKAPLPARTQYRRVVMVPLHDSTVTVVPDPERRPEADPIRRDREILRTPHAAHMNTHKRDSRPADFPPITFTKGKGSYDRYRSRTRRPIGGTESG